MDWFTPQELMPPNNKKVLCLFLFTKIDYAVCLWTGQKWVYDNSDFCPTPDMWCFIVPPEKFQ